MPSQAELLDRLQTEIDELRELPQELAREFGHRQTRIETKVDRIEEDIGALTETVKGIDEMLRGNGSERGIVGRVQSLESGSHVAVAKIEAAAHIKASKVAVLAALAGGVAGAVGSIIAVLLGG